MFNRTCAKIGLCEPGYYLILFICVLQTYHFHFFICDISVVVYLVRQRLWQGFLSHPSTAIPHSAHLPWVVLCLRYVVSFLACFSLISLFHHDRNPSFHGHPKLSSSASCFQLSSRCRINFKSKKPDMARWIGGWTKGYHIWIVEGWCSLTDWKSG